MSRATDYFLGEVGKFLARNPPAKRRELQRLHEKIDGRKLSSIAISRHVNGHMIPVFDTGIVYLRFAQINGIIEADPSGNTLFRYVSSKAPEAKPRVNPKKRAPRPAQAPKIRQ